MKAKVLIANNILFIQSNIIKFRQNILQGRIMQKSNMLTIRLRLADGGDGELSVMTESIEVAFLAISKSNVNT